jgi:lysophospholipase L1-like esterase
MANRLERKGLLIATFFLLMFGYTGWCFYQFTQVGYHFVQWHTHFAFVLIPFGTIAIAIHFLSIISCRINEYQSRLILAVISVMITLLTLETLAMTYAWWKNEPDYATLLYVNAKNPYNVWPPLETHQLASEEFCYNRFTNTLGFADSRWAIEKPVGIKRILVLGDSYVEGDGAPADSSFPAMLNSILKSKDAAVEVMNAGTCGSDPFFNFKNLHERLLVYKPDLIIQNITTSDLLHDVSFRGGMERFKPDGTVVYKANSWIIVFSECSYIFRVAMLVFENIYVRTDLYERKTDQLVNKLLSDYQQLLSNNQAKLMLVIMPKERELASNELAYNFNNIKSECYQITGSNAVDLLPLYKSYADQHKQPTGFYYWKKDRHHNSKGYEMMASVLADSVLQRLK